MNLMTPAASRIGLSAGISLVLALTSLAGVAVAAEKTAKADKKDKHPSAVIEVIKGDKYRMASAKMADRVTRFADPAGDQRFSDGRRVPEAPEWSDIKAVYVAPARMPAKLLTKMTSFYPPGTAGAFYGEGIDLGAKDRVIFVAVEMAKRLPGDVKGQQVEIGLSGNAAMPVQVETELDTRAGVETFSLGGIFSNGAYGAGTTDVSGRMPGDEIDYYNTDSGLFGFYAPERATWYLVVPRAGDADAISVAVRSNTGVGRVIDRLEMPGGGHFIDLPDPTGGFKSSAGASALTCRLLETFSAESGTVTLSDPAGTMIRYTAGLDAGTGADEAAKLLAPAIEAVGPVDVTLTAMGGDAEPITVEADLALAPGLDAVSLMFEAPAGQWSFALAEDLELKTPAGESIIDHRSLTGTAGLLTGPGLDGFVAGDPSCGLVDPAPTESVPTESAPAEEPAS